MNLHFFHQGINLSAMQVEISIFRRLVHTPTPCTPITNTLSHPPQVPHIFTIKNQAPYTSWCSLFSIASRPSRVAHTWCGASLTMSQCCKLCVTWLRSLCLSSHPLSSRILMPELMRLSGTSGFWMAVLLARSRFDSVSATRFSCNFVNMYFPVWYADCPQTRSTLFRPLKRAPGMRSRPSGDIMPRIQRTKPRLGAPTLPRSSS